MRIDIHDVYKAFEGGSRALNGINMTIADGELVALLGPSGSGKTTLLRAIAGLENPDHGDILFNGGTVAGHDVRDRKVGFVFQHYALFKTMTVRKNVSFGLSILPRKQRPSKAAIIARADELLHLVQLEGLENRYPSQLSGGQRQRVALARALAIEPSVLLLDEPFGALDAKVRKDLRRWLRELHDRTGHTTVFVTHDQEEALELSDRVAVIHQGRVEHMAPPAELYGQPATPFVCSFLGASNQLEVTVSKDQVLHCGHALPLPRPHSITDGPHQLFIRPHEFQIRSVDDQTPGILCRVETVRLSGALVRIDLRFAACGTAIEVEVPILDFERHPWKVGDAAMVTIRNVRMF
ncbi:MAG: sulfate/molybdate ABC transporter ATP-binding protein [Rhodospirillaceae bacterium]|nr:sulfate/molybdate ABC transporter ATP-binding protein [Rhodospirillaceae bacterium]